MVIIYYKNKLSINYQNKLSIYLPTVLKYDVDTMGV